MKLLKLAILRLLFLNGHVLHKAYLECNTLGLLLNEKWQIPMDSSAAKLMIIEKNKNEESNKKRKERIDEFLKKIDEENEKEIE